MARIELRAGLLALAGAIGATAMMAAAAAAHGPLASDLASMASHIQLFHALAIGLAALAPLPRWGHWGVSVLFVAGCLGFCGGLYSLAWLQTSLGPIVPLGGSAFIAGWIALAVAALKSRFPV